MIFRRDGSQGMVRKFRTTSELCLYLQHFVRNVPALHDVLVLVNIRYVPVNTVLPEERVLVSSIPGFSG